MSEPVYMLNALWFKEPGGREKYMEYGAAVAPLLEAAGAAVGEMYQSQQCLIGEWDPDALFVVKYPSQAAFEAMVSSEAYAQVMHLREESLVKSVLTRCSGFDWS